MPRLSRLETPIESLNISHMAVPEVKTRIETSGFRKIIDAEVWDPMIKQIELMRGSSSADFATHCLAIIFPERRAAFLDAYAGHMYDYKHEVAQLEAGNITLEDTQLLQYLGWWRSINPEKVDQVFAEHPKIAEVSRQMLKEENRASVFGAIDLAIKFMMAKPDEHEATLLSLSPTTTQFLREQFDSDTYSLKHGVHPSAIRPYFHNAFQYRILLPQSENKLALSDEQYQEIVGKVKHYVFRNLDWSAEYLRNAATAAATLVRIGKYGLELEFGERSSETDDGGVPPPQRSF